MSDKEKDVFGGFEQAFEQLASPEALRDSKEVDPLSMTSSEAGSLAEEIDPEELEQRLKESENKPTKNKKGDKKEEESNEEDLNLDLEDDEDIDENEDTSKNSEEEEIKEGEEESTEEDDDDITDAEIVEPFFELFSNELGWEVEEEDRPKDIKELVELMSGIIEANSKPVYANEEVAKIDEFVRNGGDLNKYYEKTIQGVDITNVKLESESEQKAVVAEYLKSTTSLSDDKITKRISRYDESGTLEEEAEEALELLKEFKTKEQEKLLKDQEKFKNTKLKEQQKFVTDVQSEIEGMDSVNGIPLSTKDKKDLITYMLKVRSDGKTSYLEDYQKSIKNLIVSAYFVKEGDKAFSKLKQKAETNAIKDLKKRIKNNKTKTKNQQPYKSSSSNTFDTIEAMSKVLSRDN